jgi:protein FRG1
MVKPLTFKGDKPKKRKTRTEDTDGTSTKTRKTTADHDNEDEDPPDDTSWVSADAPTDLGGPIVLVLPSDKPTCVASDPNGVVFASELENLVEGDAATAEPHDVRQVWVVTKVAGTDGFSFKGHHGKYVFPSSWIVVHY